MSELSDFFPRFLLNDKNGYALACALLRGMTLMQETVDAGVACVQDVNAMPEWRLDEMAWELGCLYDYSASVDVKREWIRQSTPFAAMNGTPQAIYNYLRGFFERVELEENWLYGGSAFHFRVTVSGEWNARNERWTRMATGRARMCAACWTIWRLPTTRESPFMRKAGRWPHSAIRARANCCAARHCNGGRKRA